MTIDELISELQRRREMHGGDTVVRCTWEGVIREIELSNIYFITRGFDDEGLWIDADFNADKPKDAI